MSATCAERRLLLLAVSRFSSVMGIASGLSGSQRKKSSRSTGAGGGGGASSSPAAAGGKTLAAGAAGGASSSGKVHLQSQPTMNLSSRANNASTFNLSSGIVSLDCRLVHLDDVRAKHGRYIHGLELIVTFWFSPIPFLNDSIYGYILVVLSGSRCVMLDVVLPYFLPLFSGR